MNVPHLLPPLFCALAAALAAHADAGMGVERAARLLPPGYQAAAAPSDATVRWIQVDMGASILVDKIKLFPVADWSGGGQFFPVRYKIEVCEEPAFAKPVVFADRTQSDQPDPGDVIGVFQASGARGRYVRVTATRLRNRAFALGRMEVWSGGRNVAVGRRLSDSIRGDLGLTALTRAPRPQGEEVVTDNLGNVLPVATWRPVAYAARTPVGGVRLDDGLFKTTMQNNVEYLLHSFSVDQLVRPFRERAGKPIPTGLPGPIPFWDTDLPGSNAGRFLMGAGNTLRWMNDPELRRRMNQVVDGIEECREPDGYLMGYAKDTIFQSERAAYTRSWLTHGLIDAGYAGNTKAFPLLRGYYDWFDSCPYLPEVLRRGGQGVQGMIANTRMYFTPVGKPADLQVVQRYFQEDYWMNELAKRDEAAIWLYPYDHPHNYLITSLEPYLDQYRATGDTRYRDAAEGGWSLYHDNWEHVGGSIAICEGDAYPPKSYYLHKHTGELCGSVFWAKYNQRFSLLHPDQEKYVGEIEKSIYNVGIANQVGALGIRYHANLLGRKDGQPVAADIAHNSCCEGQGTRLYGSLPEYIYSVAGDGIYVNLFAGSSISFAQAGRNVGLHMVTRFPYSPDVALHVSVASPLRSKIRVRVPAWAARDMPISINGTPVAMGRPGTFVVLDRRWRNGDAISFVLPMAFKLTRYTGAEVVEGRERYAVEYGPILMAAVGTPADTREAEFGGWEPKLFAAALSSKPDAPLHFTLRGDTRHAFVPYYEVQDQVFTCCPVIRTNAAPIAAIVGADDLALASKGATATSDSEYANEPNGTAKVIDGIIADSDDFTNRWHASIETPHPHWIQVKLPKPALIKRVIIRFADPAGYPTDFEGTVEQKGRKVVVFNVKSNRRSREYSATIAPVLSDTFRLTIQASANPAYPNAAQISEIELYP